MRSVILALLGTGTLLLAADAPAQECSIVEGSFTDAATGESTALTGGLEIEPSGIPFTDDTAVPNIEITNPRPMPRPSRGAGRGHR